MTLLYTNCCISQTKQITSNSEVLDFFDLLVSHEYPAKDVSTSYNELCYYLLDDVENSDFMSKFTENSSSIDAFILTIVDYDDPLCFWSKPSSRDDELKLQIDNYALLLDEVIVYLPQFKSYMDDFLMRGEVLASYHYGLLYLHNQLDFSNSTIRLFFAVHYLTVIYNKCRGLRSFGKSLIVSVSSRNVSLVCQ